jgi:hypothetical protein
VSLRNNNEDRETKKNSSDKGKEEAVGAQAEGGKTAIKNSVASLPQVEQQEFRNVIIGMLAALQDYARLQRDQSNNFYNKLHNDIASRSLPDSITPGYIEDFTAKVNRDIGKALDENNLHKKDLPAIFMNGYNNLEGIVSQLAQKNNVIATIAPTQNIKQEMSKPTQGLATDKNQIELLEKADALLARIKNRLLTQQTNIRFAGDPNKSMQDNIRNLKSAIQLYNDKVFDGKNNPEVENRIALLKNNLIRFKEDLNKRPYC